MSFVQPWWFLLLGLSVLIVALHTRKRRSIDVPSTFLWQRIIGTATSRPAVMRPPLNLPLILQLLALLLLVVALARPQVDTAGNVDHWVVLLDTSGAVQSGGHSESAQDYLAQHLDDHPQARFTLLEVAGRTRATAVRRNTRDPSLLEGFQDTHEQADWLAAIRLLQAIVIPTEKTLVTVLSTDSGTETAESLLNALLHDAHLQLIPFGTGTSGSRFLAAELTQLDSTGKSWRISGRALAAEPATLQVLFQPEGTQGPIEWAELDIDAGGTGQGDFDLELELPGPGLLELRLPEGGFDGRAYFVVESEPRIARVLHVGPENQPLRRGFEALEHVELFEAASLPADSSTYDLVLIDRVTTARRPGTNALWLASLPPGVPEAGNLEDPAVTGGLPVHPLLETFTLSNTRVRQALQVPRLPGAQVLLEAAGSPLLQARVIADGAEVLMAFALEDSNWPAEPTFPAFIANLVDWAVPQRGGLLGLTCRVGLPCSLPSDARITAPDGSEVVWQPPFIADAVHEPGWSSGGFGYRPVLQQAGIYEVSTKEGTHQLAVNSFGSPLQFATQIAADAGKGQVETIQERSGNWPLWRWFVLAALLVLVTEGMIAFMRRHRPGSSFNAGSLMVQATALVLLVLVLLDVPGLLPLKERSVVLISETSAVLDESGNTVLDGLVRRILTQAGQDAGRIELASDSVISSDLGEFTVSDSSGLQAGGDLAAALELAAGMLGTGGQNRIVLAASGLETKGELAPVLRRLATAGTPVDVLELPSMPAGEVLVEEVSVPGRLYAGAAFNLTAVLYSSDETTANIRITRNGLLVDELDTRLQPGRNQLEVALDEEEGTWLYEVQVSSGTDVFTENNRGGVLASVSRTPRIAIITAQPAWGQVLASALELQGLDPEVLAPINSPWNDRGWFNYDAVVLMNLPALELHSTQQRMLADWVKDHGGGLVLLGGENTFGPGGYYQTPLEDLSPLSSLVDRESPEVALLFVLDRSGSMQQLVGGITRLDIAKEATLGAVEVLDENSQAGVIVFDTVARVLLPLQPADQLEVFEAALAPLDPGGGTSIYPALVQALEQMSPVEAEAKHIIVMTDGLSQPGDFESVLKELRELNVTVSTVAIGQGADAVGLASMARLGAGAAHATTDFRALPSILSQEALLLSGISVEQSTIQPVWRDRSTEFLQGLPPSLPELHGFVRTTVKDDATLHVSAADSDGEEVPLLATWRYGLGHVAAFASHGAGSWSRDWEQLEGYPLVWAQLVRWALLQGAQPGATVTARLDGSEAKVSLEVLGDSGLPVQGLSLEVVVFTPDGRLGDVAQLNEASPGLYEARVLAEVPGIHWLGISARGQSGEIGFAPVDHPVFVPYPARYQFSLASNDLLPAIAAVTGGRMLTADSPVFTSGNQFSWRSSPAVLSWLPLSLVLFVTGLLLRYLRSRRIRPVVVKQETSIGHSNA